MRRKKLQTIIVLPFLFQIFMVVGIIGYFSFTNGQKAVSSLSTQLRQEITHRIRERLNLYLSIPQTINQINADVLRFGSLPRKDINALRHHFWLQSKAFKSVSYIEYGREDGEFVGLEMKGEGGNTYEVTEQTGNLRVYSIDDHGNPAALIETSSNYDPRKRPWYVSVAKARVPTWSNIYAWLTPPTLAISAGYPDYDHDNKFQGVFAVDLTIAKISDFLGELEISKSGKAFILERSGNIVATSSGMVPFVLKENKPMRIKATDFGDSLIQATAKFLIASFNDYGAIVNEAQMVFTNHNENQLVQITPFTDKGLDWLIVVVVPEADFMAEINANTYMTICFSILAFIVAAIIGLITAKWIAHPITALKNAATKLAHGHWEQTLPPGERAAEIAELSQTFSDMAAQLKDLFNTLEDKVIERTAQLNQSRNEMKNILDNIQIGIITLKRDGTINQEFSRFMHTLFGGETQIAGKNFGELYYWEEGREKERQVVSEWFELVFDESYEWDLIAELGPQVIAHKHNGETTYHQTTFNRIMHAGCVDSLMVNTRDITKQRLLEIAVKEQDDAYQQEMEIIAVVINQQQQAFERYLSESTQLVEQIQEQFFQLLNHQDDREIGNDLFRKMHSLKGNSRAYGMQALGRYAHLVEDVLVSLRDDEITLQSDLCNGVIASKEIAFNLAKINAALVMAWEVCKKIYGNSDSNQHDARKEVRYLNIDPQDMKHMVDLCVALEQEASAQDSALLPRLLQLKQTVLNYSLVSLSVVYERLTKIVADVAQFCRKEVDFTIHGDPVYLESQAHVTLVSALTHVLRNGVDHGIELPKVREENGKSKIGKIVLTTKTIGGKIVLSVSDDGKGLDSERVLNKAIALGLVTYEDGAKLTESEIFGFILRPGFSSAEQVSEISGRGVGMDVVADAVKQLGGTLQIHSARNQGSEFVLTIPA